MKRYGTEEYSRERMAHSCLICQPSAFFKKQAIENVGYLNISLQCSMDYELWMRFGLEHNIVYIPKLLATSRMYDENKTTARYDEMCEEVFNCLLKYYGYVPITWIYRYTNYLINIKGKKRLNRTAYFMFLKINSHNPRYIISIITDYLKTKLNYKKRGQKNTDKYEDNWVQRVYIKRLNNTSAIMKHLYIKGQHCWPLEKKLKLKIYCNEILIAFITITQKGDFEFSIPISDLVRNDYLNIKIIANAKFCPLKTEASEDQRKLSYLLNELKIM